MNLSRAGFAALATCVALVLGACGERPQVVNYKQGKYQGKPDTPAYQNDQFNSDKSAWNKAVDQRAQSQNEYVRLGGAMKAGE
jgi:hypothetical protein